MSRAEPRIRVTRVFIEAIRSVLDEGPVGSWRWLIAWCRADRRATELFIAAVLREVSE